MKKVFSITLSVLMVVAMLHIGVAMHYCEGKQVASTVSFSGKLATCGMTTPEEEMPFAGTNLTSNCCENTLTFCGVSSYYSPTYHFVPESDHFNFQVLAIPVVIPGGSLTDTYPLYTTASPPGALMYTAVNLSHICVFRI
jgi:hypothetical protein